MMSARIASHVPKIAVHLHGGLGNQIFQAAAGLALAHRLDAHMLLDTTRFRTKGLRAYALAPFGLKADVKHDTFGLASQMKRALRRVMGAGFSDGWTGIRYQEPHFHYDPAFATLAGDVLLTGYFQSPRYFTGFEGAIAAAFAPEKLASDHAKSIAARLAGEDSIAVHLRRGDFSTDAKAAAVHGVLGWAYYDAAIAHLRSYVPTARLFVVSDTPAAAAEGAARWPNAEVLAGSSAGDDFFLMSKARHHIIANSSFSWWSAWLDRRPGGITIAPQHWFTPNASQTRRCDDLIPGHWVRI